MRFIEIDGRRQDVPRCEECPCYDSYDDSCKHPDGDGEGAEDGGRWYGDPDMSYGPHCPLREGIMLDSGFIEWIRMQVSNEVLLEGMLALSLPKMLEDLAKMSPEEQEKMARKIEENLEEMRRIARMKPEERPLCTMDQEEAIKRGIEACTVKEEKG